MKEKALDKRVIPLFISLLDWKISIQEQQRAIILIGIISNY
jgi:hypothetical protein